MQPVVAFSGEIPPLQAQDHPGVMLQSVLHEELQTLNTVLIQKLASRVGQVEDIGRYLALAGGKRVRPLMTLAFAKLLGGDMSRAIGLGACVELIHTATLLHDDVVDQADMRRGKKAARVLWGNAASVLTGDFLFSRAFELMVDDGQLDILKLLSRASSTIAEGEVQQLCLLNDLNVTLEAALEVISAKTASLFAAATEVGALLSDVSPEIRQHTIDFGVYFGIAFQLTDDLMDYDPESTAGKEQGNDFMEGKVTVPVILALEKASPEQHAFWTTAFALDTSADQKETLFKTAQNIVYETKSVEQCRLMVQSYIEKAMHALQPLPDHPIRDILAGMCTHLLGRAS